MHARSGSFPPDDKSSFYFILLGWAWVSPTLVSWMVDFSYTYIYFYCLLYVIPYTLFYTLSALISLLQRFSSCVESVEIHSEDYDDPLIATFFLDSILPEVNTVLHSVRQQFS